MTRPTRILFSIVAVMGVILTAGCGTLQAYPGQRLTKEETALITLGFAAGVEILAVDGQELGIDKVKVEVLPGAHAVSARVVQAYQGGYISSPKTLRLEAQAGHVYHVFGRFLGERLFSVPTDFTIWIEDKQSKEVVAGTKPRKK